MSATGEAAPKLSLVVVVYDMAREADRTLRSLAVPYQRDVSPDDYEVVVVDNGSPKPLGHEFVTRFGPRFRYLYIANGGPSPAHALNEGSRLARAPLLGLMIDGARVLTPGVLRLALLAASACKHVLVATLGWHLGPGLQQISTNGGYAAAAEDRLLESIGWPTDGYRLFEIATLAGSSLNGWFFHLPESNCLFVSRELYFEIGGCDERFDLPGGGLVNHDLYYRLCERDEACLVVLLGEGNFHQVHRGATTSAASAASWPQLARQYEEIRGRPWTLPQKPATYLGHVPPQTLPTIAHSAATALKLLAQ